MDTSDTLFIDSRFRDFGSNVDFSVIFNNATATHTGGYPTQIFKNVVSVELTSFSVPAYYANTSGQPYLILDIEELNNRVHSNVPSVNQSFGIIYVDKDDGGSHKFIKGHDYDEKVRRFSPPISSLSRLTIKLRNPYTGAVINDEGCTTYTFKITTKTSNA